MFLKYYCQKDAAYYDMVSNVNDVCDKEIIYNQTNIDIETSLTMKSKSMGESQDSAISLLISICFISGVNATHLL